MMDEVKKVKETYLPGMRVRLLKMDDVQAPPVACEGTVMGVDDIGSVIATFEVRRYRSLDNLHVVNTMVAEQMLK